MGGFGSGLSGSIWPKTTTDECQTLDIFKKGGADFNFKASGMFTLTWRSVNTGEKTGAISYWIHQNDSIPELKLTYTFKKTQEIEYPVKLAVTNPNYGGKRYWFICPLRDKYGPCGKRVAKLYRPNGSAYFGCRHCYNLTYQSCQDSHKFDHIYQKLAYENNCSIGYVKKNLMEFL